MQGFEGFVLYYDCESKQCIVTISDAANADKEKLKYAAELCETHCHEIDIIGKYVNADNQWIHATDDDLRLIIEFWAVSDDTRRSAIQELESRTQARMGYVYLLQADNGLYKIGQTKVIDQRIKQLVVSLPYELELVLTIESEFYKEIEATFHEQFADKRARGEWFELSEADIEHIKGLGAQNN